MAVRCLRTRPRAQLDRLYAMKSIHVNRLSKSRVEEFENEVKKCSVLHVGSADLVFVFDVGRADTVDTATTEMLRALASVT